jgi:hypothetical protein
MVCRQLVMQPDVLDGQGQFLEQMENDLELAVGERFAGDAAVEHGNADQFLAVKNGHGHLCAQRFKLALDLFVRPGLVAVAPENFSRLMDLPAQARLEGQFNVFQQIIGQPDGAALAQTPGSLQSRGFPERGTRFLEENGRAVDPHHLPEQKQELRQQSVRIQRMGEDRGKMTRKFQRLKCALHRSRCAGRDFLRARGRVWGRGAERAWKGGRRRIEEPVQKTVQQPGPDGLGQDMRHTQQKGLFLHFPGTGAVIDNYGALGGALTQFLDRPNPLGIARFDVQHTRVEEAAV